MPFAPMLSGLREFKGSLSNGSSSVASMVQNYLLNQALSLSVQCLKVERMPEYCNSMRVYFVISGKITGINPRNSPRG